MISPEITCSLNKKHKVDTKKPNRPRERRETGGRHGQGAVCQPKNKNSLQ